LENKGRWSLGRIRYLKIENVMCQEEMEQDFIFGKKEDIFWRKLICDN
jgi:hypothetical protein